MSATLSVRLGNMYGESFAAQDSAEAILDSLSPDKWEYYATECLQADARILNKLTHRKPRD